MEDQAQVKAYAKADFEAPHNQFIQRLKLFINKPQFSGTALDLGCGSGDISCRFAKAFPLSKVHGVDGSEAMIDYCKLSTPKELKPRMNFILGMLPETILPQSGYEIIFCNSLLHHLHDPQVLWQVIKKYSRPDTRIVVMDLLRPDSIENAQILVNNYALDEPEILKKDFYNSLLAAFTLTEIKKQLAQAGLNFFIEQISDRHVFITGVKP